MKFQIYLFEPDDAAEITDRLVEVSDGGGDVDDGWLQVVIPVALTRQTWPFLHDLDWDADCRITKTGPS